MKEIILWRGNHHHRQDTGLRVQIDDRDFSRVSQYAWTFAAGYPAGHVRLNDRWVKVPLHRFILNARRGQLVDHIDGDTLNCQRDNLRFCTKAQNGWNRPKANNPRATSILKGVQWKTNNASNPTQGRWMVRITKNNRNHHIGYFDSEHQAAMAYDLWATLLHGRFVRTNFPTVLKGP